MRIIYNYDQSKKKDDPEFWLEIVMSGIKDGYIQFVEKADWNVSRFCPGFLEGFENLFDNNFILNLGVGDGSTNEFLKSIIPNPIIESVADRIYIDPIDVIKSAYVSNNEIKLFSQIYAEDPDASIPNVIFKIMRNELLIPNSIEDILSNNIVRIHDIEKKDLFLRKAITKRREMPIKDPSYRNLKEIINVVRYNPSILMPTNIKYRRNISRLGTNIEYRRNCQDLRNLISAVIRNNQDKDYRDVKDIIANSVIPDKIKNIDSLIITEFDKADKAIKFSKKEYEIIMGCRSDAFLKEKYPNFLKMVVGHLSDNGLYLSDGLECAHEYKIPEIKQVFQELDNDFEIYLVTRDKYDTRVPPSNVPGIIVKKKNGVDIKLKQGYSLLPWKEMDDNKRYQQQLMWTKFYEAVCEYNNNLHNKVNVIDVELLKEEIVHDIIDRMIRKSDVNEEISNLAKNLNYSDYKTRKIDL